MQEINDLMMFLTTNRTDLTQDLAEEFKIQIDKKKSFRGFKKVCYDIHLAKKMRFWLIDTFGINDPELRLILSQEERTKDLMDNIIKEVIND